MAKRKDPREAEAVRTRRDVAQKLREEAHEGKEARGIGAPRRPRVRIGKGRRRRG